MQLYTQNHGWSVVWEVGHWYFSIFFKPAHWAFTYHWKKPCCKLQIVVWMFEVNRTWTDAEFESKEYDAICWTEFN